MSRTRRTAAVGILWIVLLAATPAAGLDFSYPEPTDVRTILVAIARAGRLNLIVGDGVEGLTTFVAKDRTAEAAAIEAAVGAGFTVRKRGNLLAVRARTISPYRIARNPAQFFDPVRAVSVDARVATCTRTIMETVGRLLDQPVRVHKHTHGHAIVLVDRVEPRLFLDLFCEAMGLDWGTAGRAIVVAPFRRLDHYEIEMRLDHRS